MNNKFLIILTSVILTGASVGLLSWLLPTKGEAEVLNNKYYIEINNCGKIAIDVNSSDKEMRELFKSTDYKLPEGGQTFLTPIIKVDDRGKKIKFGIPIYGVNYWRFKWANPDLYLYDERIEDQEKFWKEAETEVEYGKIKAILNRENSTVKDNSSNSYIIDLAQTIEINNRTCNSITSFRKAIDKKIKSGDLKSGDVISLFVKCSATSIPPPSEPIPQSGVKDTLKEDIKPPLPPNLNAGKTAIQTGFTRISKVNEISWSKNLADNADQLIIEFKIGGKVFKQEDVTGKTRYQYNPGNSGQGVNTDVTLKVVFDENKYFLIGGLTKEKQLFTCSN